MRAGLWHVPTANRCAAGPGRCHAEAKSCRQGKTECCAARRCQWVEEAEFGGWAGQERQCEFGESYTWSQAKDERDTVTSKITYEAVGKQWRLECVNIKD